MRRGARACLSLCQTVMIRTGFPRGVGIVPRITIRYPKGDFVITSLSRFSNKARIEFERTRHFFR